LSRTTTTPAIAYDDTGAGDMALLCMHGWCVDRCVYADLLLECSGRRRVLALDWRGHGESDDVQADFGYDELTEDALAVVAGMQKVVAVAQSHAGWAALALRQRLGARVHAVVLIDWIVFEPSPPFVAALAGLRDAQAWPGTRELLFSMWLRGVENMKVMRLVRETMTAYDHSMWARAAREITSAYARAGSPLDAFARLDPPPPVLHVYSQPADLEYLRAQQAYAAAHPWYAVRLFGARSHYTMLESPRELAQQIEAFITVHA
jgi:pimeloyl-ACP methyl ester carboxylesterase